MNAMNVKAIALAAVIATAGAVGAVSQIDTRDPNAYACAGGPRCEWNSGLPGAVWEPAPVARTLLPGLWRGPDCYTKAGVEPAGLPGASMRRECAEWATARAPEHSSSSPKPPPTKVGSTPRGDPGKRPSSGTVMTADQVAKSDAAWSRHP